MKKLILILALLLSACGAPTSHSDTPTPVDTETAAPSPTTTATIKPSATLMPSSTPTSIAVVVSPPTSTALPFPTKSSNYHHYEVSPDGEWIAWAGAYSDVENYPHIIVENIKGDKNFLVTLPDEHHTEICLTGCWLDPVLWSADGSFLYFETFPAAMDNIINTNPAKAVMKLSLYTGQISYVLPPRQNNFYHYAFSPDGEWLVFTLLEDPTITFTLVNLPKEQGDSFIIKTQVEALGHILWSPYDHSFVFLIFGPDWQSEFYIVNAQDYSFRKIYEGISPLDEYEWYSPTEIKLTSSSYSDEPPILINIQTGETTSAD